MFVFLLLWPVRTNICCCSLNVLILVGHIGSQLTCFYDRISQVRCEPRGVTSALSRMSHYSLPTQVDPDHPRTSPALAINKRITSTIRVYQCQMSQFVVYCVFFLRKCEVYDSFVSQNRLRLQNYVSID